MKRIAVFHDAIALRRPEQSRLDAHVSANGVRAMAAFDGVLCISHEAERDLHHYWKQYGLAPAVTRVAPWPVPFHDARPATGENFAARELLYVARLEPHKNHLRLLEACDLLWREGLDFKLNLLGCMAYPDAAWRILSRVRRLRRQGRSISWRAHVSESELHAAYRDGAFTVFPSLVEGFGLPVVESLWHGRPVVCAGTGALGELAAGGGCETVDVENVESIAHGMRRLLTDRDHYHRLFAETQARTFRTWKNYEADVADFIGLAPAA